LQSINQSIAQKKQEGGKAAVDWPVVIDHLIDQSITHKKSRKVARLQLIGHV